MRKITLFGILGLLLVGGLYLKSSSKKVRPLLGREEYHIGFHEEISQIWKELKPNGEVSLCSDKELVEDLKSGKIQVAYGDTFFDQDYDGVTKSDPMAVVKFGVYSNKNTFKTIGYVHEFCALELKANYPKAKLIKFESNQQMLEALKKEEIQGICISSLIKTKLEDGYNFNQLNIEKKIVFLVSNKSNIKVAKLNKLIAKYFKTENQLRVKA